MIRWKAHLINLNDTATDIQVIVRNSRQKKLLRKKIVKPVSYITWKADEDKPPQVGSDWVYIADLYPLNEDVIWWLSRLTDRFVAG